MASIERRNLNKLRLKSLEVTSLTAEQLHYLTVTEFDKTVEETYEDCSVNIDPKNGKLTFHGTDEQNEKAKVSLVSHLKNGEVLSHYLYL